MSNKVHLVQAEIAGEIAKQGVYHFPVDKVIDITALFLSIF